MSTLTGLQTEHRVQPRPISIAIFTFARQAVAGRVEFLVAGVSVEEPRVLIGKNQAVVSCYCNAGSILGEKK